MTELVLWVALAAGVYAAGVVALVAGVLATVVVVTLARELRSPAPGHANAGRMRRHKSRFLVRPRN